MPRSQHRRREAFRCSCKNYLSVVIPLRYKVPLLRPLLQPLVLLLLLLLLQLAPPLRLPPLLLLLLFLLVLLPLLLPLPMLLLLLKIPRGSRFPLQLRQHPPLVPMPTFCCCLHAVSVSCLTVLLLPVPCI